MLVFYSSILNWHFTIASIPVIQFQWVDIILLVGAAWIFFKTTKVLFFNRVAGNASANLNIVLWQGAFISTVLYVDAVRTASFYLDSSWSVALVIVVSMVVSTWLSDKIIERLNIKARGLVLLLFSTSVLLMLEAFHQSIISELICFGTVLYIMNIYFAPKDDTLHEETKMTN